MASENKLTTVFDAATNQTIVRPMTDEELAVLEITIAQQAKLEQDRANAFEARKEPLRRLGLTEDEINTVLGL